AAGHDRAEPRPARRARAPAPRTARAGGPCDRARPRLRRGGRVTRARAVLRWGLRWTLRLLALGVLAAVALALLEAEARWRFHRIALSNPYVLREERLTPEFSEAFSDDLWLEKWFAYVPCKSITTEVDGERFEVAINSRGFRSREVEVPKPPG